MELSVIIPTYNEKKNVGILIPRIEQLFYKRYRNDFEIIVVDDKSPDGTAESIIKLNNAYGNIRLITKKKKEGIGSALKEGYSNARGSLILSTDADLSFDVRDMLRLLTAIKKGRDLVVGSRHRAGGFYEKPNIKTKIKGFISKYGNMMTRILTNIDINDFSANFRIIRRNVWKKLKVADNANSILLEMILKAKYKGYKVAEVPVMFIDRKYGKSKLSLIKEMPKFLMRLVYYIIKYRILKLG
ncbi:glycosyltransferase [Candidatus Woesearchaeota archaeon]|nr:glycosyltransferase [Candidatus Woesearchaeota archaeon]